MIVYNQRELQTPWETTNFNGGAIAMGHSQGMSVIRYLGSILTDLARRNAHKGVVGVCTDGVMAIAPFLER